MKQIIKRDNDGNQIVPTIPHADADKESHAPIKLDADVSPDTPIPDMKIENFLMQIVEQGITGTDNLFRVYCTCKFDTDKPIPIARNDMRTLLSTPRVRERLKYLRESEWELNRPNILQISRKFEELIDDEELKPNDKINALNSLAKLVGLFEKNEVDKSAKVAIIFNSQEMPPEVTIKQ